MGEAMKLPLLYFDSRAGGYWLEPSPARFLYLEKRDASLHLRQAGLDPEERVGALTALERAFWVAQVERSVDYAGPLAGHRCGAFVTSSGGRVLVTCEPRGDVFRKPEGSEECPRLEKFFAELFGPGSPQCLHVLGWLKFARQSLLLGDFRPGQLLVLAGPSNCGKSLFQAIVTEFLGGRGAAPYRYMTGQTAFNADLAMAEHWAIEDETSSTDIRARRAFGNALKVACVNREMSVHGKGRQAVTLPTFRRLTLSCNDEAENLMILPPFDASIRDKVILCRCSPATVAEDRKEAWSALASELPALAVKLAKWRVPPSIRCPRFGVQGFASPDLLEVLQSVSPEVRLLALVDSFLWDNRPSTWIGTAEELERRLRSNPEFCWQVERLLYYSSACGVYLGRLASQQPGRVSSTKERSKTVWTIKAP